MTERERVNAVLEFREPDRLPRDYWGYWDDVQAEADEFFRQIPKSIQLPQVVYGKSTRESGVPPRSKGKRIDAWGSGWESGEDGVLGEVKAPAIKGASDLDRYTPPYELLDGADLSGVGELRGVSDAFILQPWGMGPNPFERMQQLRGTEHLLMDIAYGASLFFRLRDIVHEFFLHQLTLWAKTEVDALFIMDDWGSQRGLLISPESWRELYKPLYADYCRVAKESGKAIFFHSDGNIIDILGDLIELGVNAINCQIAVNGTEEIIDRFRGDIVFWGDIDRQWTIPFGSPADVRSAVRRTAASAFAAGKTGVIAALGRTKNDPMENFQTVFTEWDRVFEEQ